VCAPITLTSFAGVASAHAELLSSDPADGSTVTSRPSTVTLTFGEDIDPKRARSRVEVDGGDGFSYSFDPRPRVEGTEVIIPLGQTKSAGEYTVTYRVVSEDGHPVEGSIAFRASKRVKVAGGTTSSTTASSTTGTSTSPEDSPSVAPAAATTATSVAATTAPTTTAAPGLPGPDDVNPALLYAIAGLAVLGAAGTAVALVLRYRSS
jgi:methionine-rich copper-binding protein CopC